MTMFTDPAAGIYPAYETQMSLLSFMQYVPYVAAFFGFLLIVGIGLKLFQWFRQRDRATIASQPKDASSTSSPTSQRRYQMPPAGWPTPK